MKRKRVGLTAVAVVSAAALTLSGCGGDNDAGDDAIPGADGGAEDHDGERGPEEDDVTDAADAGDEDDIDRPEVVLPEDMVNEFEETSLEDPDERAIVADAQRRRDAVDLAIAEGDKDHEALSFYADRGGLVADVQYVHDFVENGNTWQGTARYFDWQVTVEDGGKQGTVTYCMDETEALDKDRETGEVHEREPADSDYVAIRERVERNELGVWQSTHVSSDRGAGECLP